MERAGRRELAELVTDHLLGDEHRNVLVTVVDAEGESDELRQDGRAAAPNLDISERPVPREASAFFRRYPSMNGPFQIERVMA